MAKGLEVTITRNGKTIVVPDPILRNATAILVVSGLDTDNGIKAASYLQPVVSSEKAAGDVYHMTHPSGYDIKATSGSLIKACKIAASHADLHKQSEGLFEVIARPTTGKRGRGKAERLTADDLDSMFGDSPVQAKAAKK